jgi:hypothetical protein
MAVPVVPAKAGTQSLLDSGFRRNDVAAQSDITFENRYNFPKFLSGLLALVIAREEKQPPGLGVALPFHSSQ